MILYFFRERINNLINKRLFVTAISTKVPTDPFCFTYHLNVQYFPLPLEASHTQIVTQHPSVISVQSSAVCANQRDLMTFTSVTAENSQMLFHLCADCVWDVEHTKTPHPAIQSNRLPIG